MSDPITDLKQELMAAAERQRQQPAAFAGRWRWLRRLGRNRALLTTTTVAIAAVAALFFTAPWSNSPSFLARADAALAQSTKTILHAKWEETWTSMDAGCSVARGPNEYWIDQTPPYRFRTVGEDAPYSRRPIAQNVCSSGTISEVGGILASEFALRFVPPNAKDGHLVGFRLAPDPVKELREAIRAGRAHDEGETRLNGRTVRRIRIDPPDCRHSPCPREPTYAYVDPDTFYPVEVRRPGALVRPTAFTLFHVVERYLTFEYLPRTAANRALSNIWARHPDEPPIVPADAYND